MLVRRDEHSDSVLVDLGAAAPGARLTPVFDRSPREGECSKPEAEGAETERESRAHRPPAFRETVMSTIEFKQGAPHEWRIYENGNEHVGDVYRHRDILDPQSSYFVVHVDEHPGGPVTVHDRTRVRGVAERLVLDHPLWT